MGIDSDFLGNPISYTSTNGGDTWTLNTKLPQPPGGEAEFKSVACTSDGQICTAVGTGSLPFSYRSTNGGLTWKLSTKFQSSPEGYYGRLMSLACSSDGQTCVAVGMKMKSDQTRFFSPISYTSNNGGKTWALSPTPPLGSTATGGLLMSVSCSSDVISHCTAVGTENMSSPPLSYTSTNGGATWTLSTKQPPLPASFKDGMLFGVACSNDGLTCVGGGELSH